MKIDIEVFSKSNSSEDLSPKEGECIRVCKYCGTRFIASGRNRNRANTCNSHHYSRCVICGAEFCQDANIAQGNALGKVCSSRKCRNEYSTRRSLEAVRAKYGVDNVFQLDEVKSKIRSTNLERYGVEVASQSEEVRAKLSLMDLLFQKENKHVLSDTEFLILCKYKKSEMLLEKLVLSDMA